MSNEEKAIIQALASMKLDGILVSQECVDRITKRTQKSSKTLTLKRESLNRTRLR